jgi:putative redox protein
MSTGGEIIVITETHMGKYQVQARVAGASFLIDEPVSAGGLGTGPNPYDLLCAALGACTTMTLRLYADRKGWPLTDVRTAVRHTRAGLNAKDSFELDIALEGGLDDAQRARLMEIAERCPVHLTLARGSQVRAALMPPAMAPIQPLDGAEHMECMREACID